jgi:RimJ/RimL family protein N-acetyltransferase
MPNAEPTSPPAAPTLRSERIYLRPAERADLETFVRWFGDGQVTRYLMARAPFSLAMEGRWFERLQERQGKNDYHFVICLVADGRAIGTAGLHELDLENGSAEFGIAIGEKGEWNKGYGTEALQAISDFGFGQLRLERIWLEVYEPNARARRSYEKAGFAVEGTLRRAHFLEGEHVDVLIMSQLRDEWHTLGRARSWELNG